METRKEILEKRQKRLLEKREALKKTALTSEDIKEVRSINAQLDELNADISDVEKELAAIEAEERSAQQKQDTPPEDAKLQNGDILGAFKQNGGAQGEKRTNDNPFASMEYRSAFKAYVQSGAEIPSKFSEARAGTAISTDDTAAAIPETIMNEVINTVRKRYGNLYNKITHLNVKGGVKYPIGALKASFKWINESTVSPRQKLDPLARVSFEYHTAEIRIAQTFISQIVTLEAFESKIAEVIAIAYLQAMDYDDGD